MTIREGTQEAVGIKSRKEPAVIKEDFNYFIEGEKAQKSNTSKGTMNVVELSETEAFLQLNGCWVLCFVSACDFEGGYHFTSPYIQEMSLKGRIIMAWPPLFPLIP